MSHTITTRERQEAPVLLAGEALRAAIEADSRARLASRLRHGAPGVSGELHQRMTKCLETMVASLRTTMAPLGIDVANVSVDWMPSGTFENARRKLANVQLKVEASSTKASETGKTENHPFERMICETGK
jgi:hypothetical protein